MPPSATPPTNTSHVRSTFAEGSKGDGRSEHEGRNARKRNSDCEAGFHTVVLKRYEGSVLVFIVIFRPFIQGEESVRTRTSCCKGTCAPERRRVASRCRGISITCLKGRQSDDRRPHDAFTEARVFCSGCLAEPPSMLSELVRTSMNAMLSRETKSTAAMWPGFTVEKQIRQY